MNRCLFLFFFIAFFSIERGASAQEGNEVKLSEEFVEKAKVLFEQAITFFKEGKYKEALVKFQASMSYRPHWKLRYNMAVCHYNLENWAEAAEQLDAFLGEGKSDIPKEQAIMAVQMLDALKKKLGMLRLVGSIEGSVIKIDGKTRTGVQEGKNVYLEAGPHRITVESGGEVVIDEELLFEPGESKEIHAKLAAPEKKGTVEKKKEGVVEEKVEKKAGVKAGSEGARIKPAPGGKKDRIRSAAWGTLAGCLGLVVVGGITGGLTAKEKNLMDEAQDEYMDLYNGGATNEELGPIEQRRNEHYEKARDSLVATTVLGISAGALLVATIALFTYSSKKKSKGFPERQKLVLGGPAPLYLKIQF